MEQQKIPGGSRRMKVFIAPTEILASEEAGYNSLFLISLSYSGK
jgi:hypothetical protein